MKYLLAVCCVFVFLSCNDKPVTAASQSKPTIIKDSNLIRKEAANPYVAVDISPMDMLYYPTDYPMKKMNGEADASPVMRIIYSRPHRGGRQLFGNLVKWGQPWRLGANEATEVEFFQPVTIQNKQIDKGRYVLYAIPNENKWTLVFNKNIYSWGLKFNPEDDVAKFDVPSIMLPQTIEHFTMAFAKTAASVELIMAWENREVRLPIQF